MPGFGSWLAKLTELSGSALDPNAAEVLLRALAELYGQLRDKVRRKEPSQLLRVGELVQTERETRQAVEALASQQRNLLELTGPLAQAVSGLAKSQELSSAEVRALGKAHRHIEVTVRQLLLGMRHVKEGLRGTAGGREGMAGGGELGAGGGSLKLPKVDGLCCLSSHALGELG